MIDKYEKYLPLGSVVSINKATKRVMIIGYRIVSIETGDKIWDYVGAVYPEGLISSKFNLLFNHSDISRIYAIGYSDEEQKEYAKVLKTQPNDISVNKN